MVFVRIIAADGLVDAAIFAGDVAVEAGGDEDVGGGMGGVGEL